MGHHHPTPTPLTFRRSGWEYKVHVIFAQPPAIGNPVVASRPLTPVPDLGGIVGPYEHNHYDKEVDPHVYTNVILLFYCQTLSTFDWFSLYINWQR